ncbi:MAG: hypothetical protein JWO31_1057, partial [Phycisphaerales bacterium]|nr:hypothetical protein [Phycisphaerales bacterium]
MSNEIQLSTLGGGLPMQPVVPGMGGGLGGFHAGGPAAGAEENPLRKVHKLLRGRYLLAFVLGLVGAAGGAVAGYLSQKPAQKAEGMIEIRPVITQQDGDKVMVMFSAYIQSQMAKLMSDTLVKQAMKDPRWQKVRPGPVNEATIGAFQDKLTVAPARGSTMIITVGFADNAPDAAAVCPAAVGSLIDAYKADYDKADALNLDARIAALKTRDREVAQRISTKGQLVQNLAKQSDGDPSQVRYIEAELVDKEKVLSQVRESIAAVEQAKAGGFRTVTPEDWALVDSTIANNVKARNEIQLVVTSLVARLGERHSSVMDRRREVENLNAVITKRADDLASKYVIRWGLDGMSGSLVPKDVTYLRESEKRLMAEIEKKQALAARLREVGNQIREAQTDIAADRVLSAQIATDLRDFQFRKDQTVLAKVVNTGSVAKPDKDRRPVFAAIGFMGGAGLPVGLLMLFGLMDTRYRYSDEARASVGGIGGGGPGGLNLLGI